MSVAINNIELDNLDTNYATVCTIPQPAQSASKSTCSRPSQSIAGSSWWTSLKGRQAAARP